MLGSHFDLDKEIAAIAAKRQPDVGEAVEPATADAYADVDEKLAAFLRAIAPEAFSDKDSLIDLKRRPLR